MALASQMARSSAGGRSWGSSSSRRRRRRSGRIVLAALAVGVIAVSAWGIARLAGADRDAAAEPDRTTVAAAEVDRPSSTETRAASSAIEPRRRDPVQPPPRETNVLSMGTAPPEQASQPLRQQQPEAAESNPEPTARSPHPAREQAERTPERQPTEASRTPGESGGGLAADLRDTLSAADRALRENNPVEARRLLNRALLDDRTPEQQRPVLRRRLAEINETLLFSPTVVRGDPLTEHYTVQRGDSLARIASRQGLGVDWRFIQRINRMSDPNRLQVGQTLKLVRGPFHAVVHKSEYRLDLYAGNPVPPGTSSGTRPDGVEPGWIYIRSFPVGLGEYGLTPVGNFVVRENSKLINPAWTNPRTGEQFRGGDPENPIGDRWLGIVGVDDATSAYQGYGLHGTVEPESIGQDMSMGCVRLLPGDIALVWEMLEERVSTVRILP